MKNEVIAYDIKHLDRLTDKYLQTLLRTTQHYTLSSLLAKDDRRKHTFPQHLSVPDLRVTEELKLRIQQAFCTVGLPVIFASI